jgi:hypothetical protein
MSSHYYHQPDDARYDARYGARHAQYDDYYYGYGNYDYYAHVNQHDAQLQQGHEYYYYGEEPPPPQQQPWEVGGPHHPFPLPPAAGPGGVGAQGEPPSAASAAFAAPPNPHFFRTAEPFDDVASALHFQQQHQQYHRHQQYIEWEVETEEENSGALVDDSLLHQNPAGTPTHDTIISNPHDYQSSHRDIYVPDDKVGLVIGNGGVNVAYFQRQSVGGENACELYNKKANPN